MIILFIQETPMENTNSLIFIAFSALTLVSLLNKLGFPVDFHKLLNLFCLKGSFYPLTFQIRSIGLYQGNDKHHSSLLEKLMLTPPNLPLTFSAFFCFNFAPSFKASSKNSCKVIRPLVSSSYTLSQML